MNVSFGSLAKALKADPFRPFHICLTDGRNLPVPSPELVAFNVKGQSIVVLDTGDGFEVIDRAHVMSLMYAPLDKS